MRDGFHTLGLAWSPVYLLDGKRPLLFESGFACAGEIYARGIRSVLDTRQPEILFLTHVHYDHCGAAAYLRNAFPSLKVATSQRAAETLKRPHATELIAKLSESALPLVAAVPGVDPAQLLHNAFQPFDTDILLEDGQTIKLGKDLRIDVLATPGHTRDHLSYYIPEKRILIATEASGCLDRAGNLITEFLIDYDAYVSSLKRLASLQAEILCQGHHFVFVGREEVAGFLSRSITEAELFKERVHELLNVESGSIERVVRRIKAEQWDTNTSIKQPEAPYLLNLTAQVTHLAEKVITDGDR